MENYLPSPRTDVWFDSIDQTQLWYGTSGAQTGVPLVFCDGIGCDGYIWRYLLPYLAPKHPILHWNYRGHGRSGSPAEAEAVSVSHLARDLRAVLDHAGISQAVLLGHSMGVQVILEAWRQFPERILGLVPICGSYGRPLDTFRDTRVLSTLVPLLRALVLRFPKQSQRIWSLALPSRLALVVAFLTEFNRTLISPDDVIPYLRHMGNLDITVFFRMLLHCGEHNAREVLSSIDVPMLVVAGGRDTITPSWLSRDMARWVSHAELLVVPWGTHTAPLEVPALVNLRVEKFLREHFSALTGRDGLGTSLDSHEQRRQAP
jgi:pimeloyl-ACP methyl ester carboxylesterase